MFSNVGLNEVSLDLLEIQLLTVKLIANDECAVQFAFSTSFIMPLNLEMFPNSISTLKLVLRLGVTIRRFSSDRMKG